MQETIKRILRESVYGEFFDERKELEFMILSDKIATALQNESQILTCVYCGFQYEPGTPTSNHESLTKHISECKKHPMFAIKEENKLLREAISYIGRALPCALIDVLGKERYEAIHGPSDEDEEEGEK